MLPARAKVLLNAFPLGFLKAIAIIVESKSSMREL
jgi:hypothetical protein